MYSGSPMTFSKGSGHVRFAPQLPPVIPQKAPNDHHFCARGEYFLDEGSDGTVHLHYFPFFGDEGLDLPLYEDGEKIIAYYPGDEAKVFESWEDLERDLKRWGIPSNVYTSLDDAKLPLPIGEWCVVIKDRISTLYVQGIESLQEFTFFLDRERETPPRHTVSGNDQVFSTFIEFLASCKTGENGTRFPLLPPDVLIHERQAGEEKERELQPGSFQIRFGGKTCLLKIVGVSLQGDRIEGGLRIDQKIFFEREEGRRTGPFHSLDTLLFHLGVQEEVPTVFPYKDPIVQRLSQEKKRFVESGHPAVKEKAGDYYVFYREGKFYLSLFTHKRCVFELDREGKLPSPFHSDGRLIPFEEMLGAGAGWRSILPSEKQVFPTTVPFDRKAWGVGNYALSRIEDEGIRVHYLPFGGDDLEECVLTLEQEGFSCGTDQFSCWNDFLSSLKKYNLLRIPFFQEGQAPDPSKMEEDDHYVTPSSEKKEGYYHYVFKASKRFIRKVEFHLAEDGEVIDSQQKTHNSFSRFCFFHQYDAVHTYPYLSNQVLWSYQKAKERASSLNPGESLLSKPSQSDENRGVIFWKRTSHSLLVRWRVENPDEKTFVLSDADMKVKYGRFSSYEEVQKAVDEWEKDLIIATVSIAEEVLLGTKEEPPLPETALIDTGKRVDKTPIYAFHLGGKKRGCIVIANAQLCVYSRKAHYQEKFQSFSDLVATFKADTLMVN